jgi:hypothetical protein
MPATETRTHFTAWLTTDTTCLDQGCADVTVLKDELHGEPDDPGAWSSTGDPLHYAVTTVNAADGDHDDALSEAKALLATAGWRVVGSWEAVPTGYTATVERDA